MRMLAIGLLVGVGCGTEQAHPVMHDAKPMADAALPGDVDLPFCDAPLGSANLTVVETASTTFARLHAGATLDAGPVAPAASGTPMGIVLLFTQSDHVAQDSASCCETSGSGCCSLTGVAAGLTELITSDSAIGAHPISITDFQDPMFKASGTLTITGFANPFDQRPGRIAGTISTTDSSVSGTFDNAFCPAILNVTI